MGAGMEVLSIAVNASFASLDQIPQKGRHLDTLEPRDRLFIWLNRLTAVPFVYHLLYTCSASPSIRTSFQVRMLCFDTPSPTPTVLCGLPFAHPGFTTPAVRLLAPSRCRCACCVARPHGHTVRTPPDR
jgi:hypothetical protein